jgi:hypothetical protein
LSAAGCDHEQNDMPLLKSHGNPSSFDMTIAVTPPERTMAPWRSRDAHQESPVRLQYFCLETCQPEVRNDVSEGCTTYGFL